MTRTATSSDRAADVLRQLATLRMQGQRPTRAVQVVTERDWASMYRDGRTPVIEVWRRDLGALDWRAIAGLRVDVCVSWTSYEERLQLFEEIRDGLPSSLHWYAFNPRGHGHSLDRWMGCMWLEGGVPMDWHTPFDEMLERAAEGTKIVDPPLKPGEQLVSYGRV